MVIFSSLIAASTLKVSKIVSVYDGDTIKVDLKCNTNILCKNMSIRVAGIDTPEIRTTDDGEKILGYLAKDVAVKFIEQNRITLKNCQRGKYFRLVCDVDSVDGKSLSQTLIDANLAVEYNGGTKVKDWSIHKLGE